MFPEHGQPTVFPAHGQPSSGHSSFFLPCHLAVSFLILLLARPVLLVFPRLQDMDKHFIDMNLVLFRVPPVHPYWHLR